MIKKSFTSRHKSALKFTDDQIALHWISNENRQQKDGYVIEN